MTIQNRIHYCYPDMNQDRVHAEEIREVVDGSRTECFDHSAHNYSLRKLYHIKRPGNNGPQGMVE